MSSIKKNLYSKKKTTFFEQQMHSINKIRRKKHQMTAEEINFILDRHFLTLELMKYNLFGEDFENYGNIELNGQTYYPYKLNLDYLVNQQNDDIKYDYDIDFDLLNSLKKADDANKINLRKMSIKRQMTLTKYKNLIKNKSMENIRNDNKAKNSNKLELPDLFNHNNYHNHHAKIKLANNYMKAILLKNFPEPLNSLNRKDFIMTKTSYLNRHGKAFNLNKKLEYLENKVKSIDNKIKNDIIINKEKTPQFKFRYRYVESKFRV